MPKVVIASNLVVPVVIYHQVILSHGGQVDILRCVDDI